MKQKTFWRHLLDGLASIGQGWFDILNSWAPIQKPWRYEDRFGSDAEQIANDWKVVGDDLRTTMNEMTSKEEADE